MEKYDKREKRNNKIIDGQIDNVICRADVHKKEIWYVTYI